MRWLATLSLVVVAWGVSAEAAVEFKILTASGFVAFPAEDPWPVISMKTKPPIAVAIFQIPNPADQGTPESTNLSITIFELDSEEARDAFRRVGEPHGQAEPKVVETLQGWTVFRQEAKQGAVEYSLVDAKRQLAGAAVAVRLAWPHLERNPSDYDRQMEAILRWVLASSNEHARPYERRDGDRILRPRG